jgi:hypothetical protein
MKINPSKKVAHVIVVSTKQPCLSLPKDGKIPQDVLAPFSQKTEYGSDSGVICFLLEEGTKQKQG